MQLDGELVFRRDGFAFEHPEFFDPERAFERERYDHAGRLPCAVAGDAGGAAFDERRHDVLNFFGVLEFARTFGVFARDFGAAHGFERRHRRFFLVAVEFAFHDA